MSPPDQYYTNPETLRSEFLRFTNQLYLILNQKTLVGKPLQMSDQNFLKIKPIIEKLVVSGDLKKEWLKLYDQL